MKKKMGAVLLVIIISLALGLPAPQAALAAGNIIYVDDDATGANDGTSWDNAYTDLQSALASAEAGKEIWVAAGTYKPGTDRTDTFQLKSHVALYGGFTGDETTRDERDWVANQTILSGDIGTVGDSSDNSYHVVTSEDTKGAILDGFTITSGNASRWPNNTGGGIWNYYGKLTVNNCIIYGNTATFRGGGLFNSGGTVTLNWVIISQNTSTGSTGGATGGGGIEVSGISATYTTVNLINCIVNGNTATASDNRLGDGGGIRVGGPNTELNIINSTIVNNTCKSYDVSNNIGGGGIRAAITTTIKNSILWGNKAGSDLNQILYPSTTNTQVIYSDIDDGIEGRGTITYKHIKTDDPLFVPMSDFHLSPDSPCIDAGKNSAVPAGVTVDLDGNPRIVNRTVDMGAFEYLTAQQANTLDLIEQVGDLVDGEVLNPGQGNSLIVKLEAAFDQMYQQENTAIKQLEAFIKQVEDFVEMEILTEEQGKPLIDTANGIIEEL